MGEDVKKLCSDVTEVSSLVPEPPELVLVWLECLVFPGPRVSSAVSKPNVVASVGQDVAQTGVWKVGDPVTAGG